MRWGSTGYRFGASCHADASRYGCPAKVVAVQRRCVIDLDLKSRRLSHRADCSRGPQCHDHQYPLQILPSTRIPKSWPFLAPHCPILVISRVSAFLYRASSDAFTCSAAWTACSGAQGRRPSSTTSAPPRLRASRPPRPAAPQGTPTGPSRPRARRRGKRPRGRAPGPGNENAGSRNLRSGCRRLPYRQRSVRTAWRSSTPRRSRGCRRRPPYSPGSPGARSGLHPRRGRRPPRHGSGSSSRSPSG